MGVSCALSEPQFDADLLTTVFDGTGVKTAVIDPVGAAIPAGPAFYHHVTGDADRFAVLLQRIAVRQARACATGGWPIWRPPSWTCSAWSSPRR